jgi:hypothetical protein
MNKPTHIMLGEVLLIRLQNSLDITLDKDAFLFGSVCPDYSVSFLTKPHLLKNYGNDVQNKLRRLLERTPDTGHIGRSRSRQLGMICHYYEDFFCTPHNRPLPGGVAGHLNYERALWHYIQAHIHDCFDNESEMTDTGRQIINSDDIFGRFESLYTAYLNVQPSYEADIKFSIQACSEMLSLTLRASMPAAEKHMCFRYPALQTV